MTNTLAHNYYLKALDEYPYSLSEFIEAIHYALSYDENDANANCLMGRYYMEQLFAYKEAKFHFEKALIADVDHIQTHYFFIQWAIQTNQFQLAKKLLRKSADIVGIDLAVLSHKRGLIAEKKGRLKKAGNHYKQAVQLSISSDDMDFYQREKTRVKEKRKALKK